MLRRRGITRQRCRGSRRQLEQRCAGRRSPICWKQIFDWCSPVLAMVVSHERTGMAAVDVVHGLARAGWGRIYALQLLWVERQRSGAAWFGWCAVVTSWSGMWLMAVAGCCGIVVIGVQVRGLLVMAGMDLS